MLLKFTFKHINLIMCFQNWSTKTNQVVEHYPFHSHVHSHLHDYQGEMFEGGV